MQLSVIILNYNVRYFLELCLISVQNAIQNIDAEIIVVDNNSPDDSCEMIKERFPNVKLIENKQNFGFPKGNNIGVAACSGEYICILNPDTVVAEDTFTKIFDRKNWNSKIGIIGCKLIDGRGNFLPESKRGVPTPFVAFTKIMKLYKISDFFGKYYAQHLSENQSGKVDILVGAFMVMKRDLYLKVGGFDENCFMYSDDIDLSYMVSQLDFENYYCHETSVIHYKGESTIKDSTYMKRFQEAMNFFYKKHFKVSVFFSIFMKIGIVLFSFVKKFQGIATASKNEIDSYILISNDSQAGEILKYNLENHLKKSVEIVTISESFKNRKNIEIIFDNNSVDFKSIIHFMEITKNQNLTYKILPQNTNFLIGSNSSNERGEVVLLDF